MSTEKEIIDVPQTHRSKSELSRLQKNLLKIIGVLFLILGTYAIFVFVETVVQVIDYLSTTNAEMTGKSWLRLFMNETIEGTSGFVLLFGGFGLFRNFRFGWSLSLGVALFVALIPALTELTVYLLAFNSSVSMGWIWLVIMVVFGSISAFLLWGKIRREFTPTPVSYLSAVVILLTLCLQFLWVPLTMMV